MNFADSATLSMREPTRDGGRMLLVVPSLIALALVALQVAPLGVATVRDGMLFDNDDAMRLVQLREWLGGRGWFDLVQHRVNPADSPVAHWSRVVELPLAGLIFLLRSGAEPIAAERIAAVLWPSLLLAAFVLVLFALARRLVGAPALLLGAVVLALNPVLIFQFVPGRIDHHGAQLALLAGLLSLTAGSLFRRCHACAAAAGVVCAVMLAIGLETVPLIGAVAAAFGMAWIVRGESSRGPVAAFGASLALATAGAFLATVPPDRWLSPTVDSLSLPWLWLAVGGGLLLFGLARMPQPSKRRRRAGYAFSGGATLFILFAALWPASLAGPYANVSPLARELWLSGVGEARPLPLLVLRNPTQFLFFLAFPLIGWLGLAAAAVRDGRREPTFILLLALATVALGVALHQMRGAPFAAMLGLFGWLYLIDWAMKAGARARGSSRRAARFMMAGVTFAAALPGGWDAAAAAISPKTSGERPSCGDPADLAELATQPAGLVLAPLRLGPRILLATPHSVLGAPYHRNVDGNEMALAALSSDPSAARRMVDERDVSYVALCLGDPDIDRLGSLSSDALVRRLVANEPPAWLSPLQQVGPIRAWRVVREEN